MPVTSRRTRLHDVPDAAALWAWHARPGAFDRLVPPWQRMDVLAPPVLEEGGGATFRAHLGPLRWTWEARHEAVEPGRGFVDVAIRGPFARWRHTHRFEGGPDGVVLADSVDWGLPLGPLTEPVLSWAFQRMLTDLLRFRHRRTQQDMSRHAAFASRPRLRVGITGATGLVGTALSAFLSTGGHTVVPFSRRAGRGDGIRWDPAAGVLDPRDLESLDAVVHLAGEPISGRWTPARRARIVSSRVDGTALLARAMAAAGGPLVLLSASAVGVYGHQEEIVDEDSTLGKGFLADTGRAWEAAADPARAAGVRVVHPRIGIVQSARGGALAAQLPLFRAGLGGPAGSGRQGLPWIALDDLVGLLHHLLFTEVEGPINATAPGLVTQAEWARTLGRVLGRPALLPAPAPALRAMLGREEADALVLQGARVAPTRALQSGFTFLSPKLEPALRWELGALPPEDPDGR